MADEENGQNPAENPNSQSFTPVPGTPSPQQSIVTGPSAADPNQPKENTGQLVKGVHWITRATFWSQVGLGIIGIAALLIYYEQLGQMTKATEANTRAVQLAEDSFEINDGNFDRMMQRTIDQTTAQLQSAQAAQDAIKTARDQMRLDQRAWVAVVGASIDPVEAGKVIYGHAVVFNSGKTVAKHVIAHWHLIFSPVLLNALPPTEKPTEPESVGVIAPTGRYDSKFSTSKVSATELDKTRITGDWYTYIWGEIEYIDIFKQSHQTLFCSYRQGAAGDFNQCAIHNDAN